MTKIIFIFQLREKKESPEIWIERIIYSLLLSYSFLFLNPKVTWLDSSPILILSFTSGDAICLSLYHLNISSILWHATRNYPQLPNTQTGAERNFFRIYGNNFMFSLLAISTAQEKNLLLILVIYFSIKLFSWFLAKRSSREWRTPWVCVKLELSCKDKCNPTLSSAQCHLLRNLNSKTKVIWNHWVILRDILYLSLSQQHFDEETRQRQ